MLRTSGLGLGVGSRGNLFLGSPRQLLSHNQKQGLFCAPEVAFSGPGRGPFPLRHGFTFDFPGLTEVSSKGALPAAILCLGLQVHSSSLPFSFLPSSSYFSSLLLSESPYSFSLLICAFSSICFKLFTHFFHRSEPQVFSVPSPNPVLEGITSALSFFNHLLFQCFQKWKFITTKVVYSFLGVVTYLGASMVTQR